MIGWRRKLRPRDHTKRRRLSSRYIISGVTASSFLVSCTALLYHSFEAHLGHGRQDSSWKQLEAAMTALKAVNAATIPINEEDKHLLKR